MLIELRVRDLATIADVTLQLGPGLNVLTGETGAGKSMLVDALALFNGERTRDIVKRANTMPPVLAYAPSREDAENGLFADLEPATRAWVLDRYTPHPTGCSEVPVRLTDFWDQSWKATVLWCRQSPNPGEAHQRRAASRLGARWLELDTGHYPMLSMPEELTRMLIDAG